MLELAHKLADSDRKFFSGWVLAGVEAHIHGQATELENQLAAYVDSFKVFSIKL